MEAVFTYAAVYQAEAACRTPLRTGGTDGDPEQVLRSRNGQAFVQGASLAGAMKDYLTSTSGPTLSKAIFGGPEGAGHLLVSDAVFEEPAEQYTRPRLKIDPTTAAGADGKKFDMAHIGTGAKLRFSLTWLGTAESAKQELPIVEQLLAAMDAGAIRLGAQKSNGFGQLTLKVRKRTFDLADAGDRQAWLSDKWEGRPLPLPKLEQKQEVVFTVTGRSENILVKSAPVLERKDDKTSTYTPNLSEGGRDVLPGSSIKGAVRARAEYISKVLGLKKDLVKQYFGREAQNDDNGLPGQVRFQDALLSDQKKRISRIHIDHFTGGVFRGGLFTEEPISTGLTLRITAPNEPEICGLLLYALRDLGLGLYNLGSGWAIGRGQVSVERIQAVAPDGQTALLCLDGQGGMKLEDPSSLFRGWLERLEGMRHEA